MSTLIAEPETNQLPVLTTQPRRRHRSPLLLFLALECALLLLAAVLPLRGIWFTNAFVETKLGSWMLFPTHLLFPGQAIIPSQPRHGDHPASLALSWGETLLLLGTFILLFLYSLLAVRFLAHRISRRYILLSSALLGLTCTCIPVVTSQDLFSYIAYARMGVFYHLNPLTTLPTAISTDPIYSYLYWVRQPSAYGPTWVIISCSLQWLAQTFGSHQVLPMILCLRLFSLLMHLGSVQLIWSISGYLQRFYPFISSRRRVQATLAFAWNPLLLVDACLNAHNDTTILFLILLALWFLVANMDNVPRAYLLSAATLAVAAGLKITFILFAPGLFLFLWAQQPRQLRPLFATLIVYGTTLLLLYAPFWQHGEVLHVFQVTPAIYHAINTPYEFLSDLYATLAGVRLAPATVAASSPVEALAHRISTVLFMLVYAILCLRALFAPQCLRTLPALFRWMALTWLLYCLIGTPWFWPWYSITFFGLYALVEVTNKQGGPFSRLLPSPLTVCLFAFCMLSLYWFQAWPLHATFLYLLPHFQWAYFRGLWVWAWIVPSLVVRLSPSIPFIQRSYLPRQKQ